MSASAPFLFCRRAIGLFMVVVFALSHVDGYAQSAFLALLPEPGKMVGVSPAFTPVLVKGLVVHPDKPLDFDFIIDTGNQIGVETQNFASLQNESQKMAKYFLAAVTVPEDQLWVNLSPYEKDRVIEDELGSTELGRDMLAQDYLLKQLTASLIYPEEGLGKDFWARVYREAQEKFATTDIPVDTFNKVWIMPGEAEVFEKNIGPAQGPARTSDGVAVYVTKSRLKVMLDSDYMAAQNATRTRRHGAEGSVSPSTLPSEIELDTQATQGADRMPAAHDMTKNLIREIILPAIEKEVNEGKNFAAIRQIYHAAILAKWYRELVQNTLLAQAYVGQNKVDGVTTDEKTLKEEIYQRYIAAYKKGVFNYIKDESLNSLPLVGRAGEGVTARKYFSGGISGFAMQAMPLARTDNAAAIPAAKGSLFDVQVRIEQSRPDPAMTNKLYELSTFLSDVPGMDELSVAVKNVSQYSIALSLGMATGVAVAVKWWRQYSVAWNTDILLKGDESAARMAQERLKRIGPRARLYLNAKAMELERAYRDHLEQLVKAPSMGRYLREGLPTGKAYGNIYDIEIQHQRVSATIRAIDDSLDAAMGPVARKFIMVLGLAGLALAGYYAEDIVDKVLTVIRPVVGGMYDAVVPNDQAENRDHAMADGLIILSATGIFMAVKSWEWWRAQKNFLKHQLVKTVSEWPGLDHKTRAYLMAHIDRLVAAFTYRAAIETEYRVESHLDRWGNKVVDAARFVARRELYVGGKSRYLKTYEYKAVADDQFEGRDHDYSLVRRLNVHGLGNFLNGINAGNVVESVNRLKVQDELEALEDFSWPRQGSDKAQTINGGIDIQDINVGLKDGPASIKFNEEVLLQELGYGFRGFTPVIIHVTPLVSPFDVIAFSSSPDRRPGS